MSEHQMNIFDYMKKPKQSKKLNGQGLDTHKTPINHQTYKRRLNHLIRTHDSLNYKQAYSFMKSKLYRHNAKNGLNKATHEMYLLRVNPKWTHGGHFRSVSSIAKYYGIARSTLYRYYSKKYHSK